MLVGQNGHVKCGDELRQGEISEPQAVFPVREVDGVGEIDEDELICQPCEEEQAATPGVLPHVYQQARSEYLDHCISHVSV